jgi:hypothetical protein
MLLGLRIVANLDFHLHNESCLLVDTQMTPENSVDVRRSFTQSAPKLWEQIGDPRRLCAVVPMLRAFRVKGEFSTGTCLEEVHTIGGWPQRYIGRVLHYRKNASWAMSSAPVHALPFGLWHTVSYNLSTVTFETELRIRCSYRRMGLLRLVPEWLVRAAMRKTLNRILAHVARSLEGR